VTRCNDLSEQMGVGAGDHADDADETPEPCRGCGRTDCGEQCAQFRAWLTVAYLDWDAAGGGDADDLA
jgi:hypothetical protein